MPELLLDIRPASECLLTPNVRGVSSGKPKSPLRQNPRSKRIEFKWIEERDITDNKQSSTSERLEVTDSSASTTQTQPATQPDVTPEKVQQPATTQEQASEKAQSAQVGALAMLATAGPRPKAKPEAKGTAKPKAKAKGKADLKAKGKAKQVIGPSDIAFHQDHTVSNKFSGQPELKIVWTLHQLIDRCLCLLGEGIPCSQPENDQQEDRIHCPAVLDHHAASDFLRGEGVLGSHTVSFVRVINWLRSSLAKPSPAPENQATSQTTDMVTTWIQNSTDVPRAQMIRIRSASQLCEFFR